MERTTPAVHVPAVVPPSPLVCTVAVRLSCPGGGCTPAHPMIGPGIDFSCLGIDGSRDGAICWPKCGTRCGNISRYGVAALLQYVALTYVWAPTYDL